MTSLDVDNPVHSNIIAQARAIVIRHGDYAITDCWFRENDKSLHTNIIKHKIHFKDIQAEIGVKERNRERKWQEALIDWKKLYDQHGSGALLQKWYRGNGYMSLRNKTAQCNRNMDDVIEHLEIEGLQEAIKELRNPTVKYDKEEFESEARQIIKTFQCLPSARFLVKNGHSKFSHSVSTFGPTFEAVRKRYGIDNVLLTSTDGQKWLSFAEVCVVNYLLARKIEVLPGKRYDAKWSSFSGKSYGIYDMHFVANKGHLAGTEMNVEVFGGGPRGNSSEYQNTRALKIKFHEGSANFIFLNFQDCYHESKLKYHMGQYIKEDVIDLPVQNFPTTMLSSLEYVLQRCKKIMSFTSDKRLPSLAWFNRESEFKRRSIEPWEPQSWAGFVRMLNSIGINHVRTLLGQPKPSVKNTKYKYGPTNGRKYKGIHKRNNHSWRALFVYKTIRHDFGSHRSARLAAIAYNDGIKRLNIPNAYLNDISEDEEE